VKAGRKFVVPPEAPWTWVKMEKNNTQTAGMNFLKMRLMRDILSVLFPGARFFAASGHGAM
jgi:hypothetical protein